jgi:hypothetical protein
MYDPRDGSLVASGSASGFSGLAGFNLMKEAVDGILPVLSSYPDILSGRRELDSRTAKLITFVSDDEGMELRLPGGVFLGTMRGDSLPVDIEDHGFVFGDTLIVEKNLSGYYPDTERLILKKDGQVVNLKPMRRKTESAGILEISLGQIPGLGLRYRNYLSSDSFFLELRNYLFFQYDFALASRPATHDDLGFTVGAYLFFSPDSPFRMGVSTGAGVIFSVLPVRDLPCYTDFYIDAGNIFLELNLRKLSFFFETEGKYTLGIGNNLLGQGWLFIPNSGPVMSLGVMKKW